MATGTPDRRRRSSLSGGTLGGARRRGRGGSGVALRLALWLPLSLLAAGAAAPSLSAALSATEPATDGAAGAAPLERIDYRRDGIEKRAIGEVVLSGERVRLRLFSDELANHYEVWVDLADFLGASPIGAEESARIRAERAAAVTVRLAEREAARARRAAAKEREAAERSASAGAGKSSRRAASGGAALSEGSESAGAAGVVDRPEGGVPLPRSTAELAELTGALATRRAAAAERAAELIGEIAERLPGARAAIRPLRDLAGRVEEASLSLERIEKSLGGRRDAMGRIESESAEGSLRGSALADQIELVGAQLVRLAGDVKRAEEALAASARDLGAIPAEAPRAETAPEVVAAAPAAARSGASSRAPAEVRPAGGAAAAPGGSAVVPALAASSVESPDPARPPRASAAERSRAGTAPGGAPSAERAAPAAGSAPPGEGSGGSSGGGLPIWPLYPVAALSLYFLWRGSRPRDRGADRGPKRPDEARHQRPATPSPRRSGSPLR